LTKAPFCAIIKIQKKRRCKPCLRKYGLSLALARFRHLRLRLKMLWISLTTSKFSRSRILRGGKKPLDKLPEVCYNKGTNEREEMIS
jgi:hypothetical protein